MPAWPPASIAIKRGAKDLKRYSGAARFRSDPGRRWRGANVVEKVLTAKEESRRFAARRRRVKRVVVHRRIALREEPRPIDLPTLAHGHVGHRAGDGAGCSWRGKINRDSTPNLPLLLAWQYNAASGDKPDVWQKPVGQADSPCLTPRTAKKTF